VPFLLETTFTEQGGVYSKGADWGSFVVEDGKLITGQNPGSSEGVADALLAMLKK
jgi:putative intracellular protease/amidase